LVVEPTTRFQVQLSDRDATATIVFVSVSGICRLLVAWENALRDRAIHDEPIIEGIDRHTPGSVEREVHDPDGPVLVIEHSVGRSRDVVVSGSIKLDGDEVIDTFSAGALQEIRSGTIEIQR
jgi:hypothetical protein